MGRRPATVPPRALDLRRPATLAMGFVLALALVGYAFVSLHKQLASGNDFPLYWTAARALLRGASPYDVASGLHGYVYLPAFALALVPLALLPLPVAAACWYAIVAGLCAWCCAQTYELVAGEAAVGTTRWALLGTGVALSGVVLDNLALGQANALVTGLVLLGVRRARAGRSDFAAGLCFGAAAVIKPYALLFAGPLLVRGRVRGALGAAAGFVALAALLPMLVLGPSRTLSLLDEWNRKVVVPTGQGVLQGSNVRDQSPQAALRRFVVAEPAFDGRRVNLVALGPDTYRDLNRGLSLAFLVALVAVWAAGRDKARPRALLLDFGLAGAGMLLAVGYNLKAHFLALLFPGALAVATAPPRARPWLGAAGALLFLSSPGIVGRTASDWMLAYSSMTVAALAVATVLAVSRLRSPSALARSQRR